MTPAVRSPRAIGRGEDQTVRFTLDHGDDRDCPTKTGTGVRLGAQGPGRGGFTLVELMIAMVLGLVVLGAMYGVFTLQNRELGNQEQVVDIQQNARAAIDIISRDIRMAGFNPQRVTGTFGFQLSASEGRATNQGSVAFTCDEDGDGTLDANDREQIAFRVSGGVLERYSIAADGTKSWQPIVEGIEALNFTYTLADGTVVANPTSAQIPSIAQVQIQVTARTAKQDPAYTDPVNNDHYRRYTLTAGVVPRNL